MTIHIRPLGPGDEQLLRTTRLRALRDAPAAFGTTYEVAAARDDDFWKHQVAGHLGDQRCATWVAGDGAGMITALDDGDHTELIQVWVTPEHRGTGLVDRLLDHAIQWSRHDCIELDVGAANERARRAYERLGFIEVGRHAGGTGDEITMTLRRRDRRSPRASRSTP